MHRYSESDRCRLLLQGIVRCPEHAFAAMGYRVRRHPCKVEVHVGKLSRERTAKSLKSWMKRRVTVELGFGHWSEAIADSIMVKAMVGNG